MGKLIFGKPKSEANADDKTETNLADKAKGFQFKLPATTAERSGEAADVKPTSHAQSEKSQVIAQNADKQNANAVESIPHVTDETASQPKNPDTNIPEMSDDKYEVVANSSDSFSEESGNKFQQQLSMLQQAIDGVGDLRDGMQNILNFLDDNPQYKNNISPRDVSVFVAACRKVAGITVTEKKARVTKRKASSAIESDIMADLADLDLDLGI